MNERPSMKYKITVYNDFIEPYTCSTNPKVSAVCNHISNEIYETYSKDVFNELLYGFIDAPKSLLTSDDIRKDFDSIDRQLSDTRVDAIAKYYNGRYELKKNIDATLNEIDISKLESNHTMSFKFNIPFELNFFSCEDNDPIEAQTKQNWAFILIDITKEDIKEDGKEEQ